MAIDVNEFPETQPESQIATQQFSNGSQESQRRENHLWGYLLPCNSNLARIDFDKCKRKYLIGRNVSKVISNDFILPGMKISEYIVPTALTVAQSRVSSLNEY